MIVLNGGAPAPAPAPSGGGGALPPVAQPPAGEPPIAQPPVAQPPATSPPVAQTPAPAPGAGGSVPVLPPAQGPSAPVVVPPPTAPVLTARGSICVSGSESAATTAQVRVICSTGQFVSIEPMPGHPFVGTHGGAFRFSFGPGGTAFGGLADFGKINVGGGTVTALRVVNLADSQTPLEMLVSF